MENVNYQLFEWIWCLQNKDFMNKSEINVELCPQDELSSTLPAIPHWRFHWHDHGVLHVSQLRLAWLVAQKASERGAAEKATGARFHESM